MEKRRRTQAACITGLVFILHLAAIWLLLANSRVIARRTDSGGFEVVLIAATSLPERKSLEHEPSDALPHRRASANRAPIEHPAPPEEDSNAIHAPIDWASELSRAAKDATGDKPEQGAKDFGFPRRPPATAKAPQFEWDHAATHRVEKLASGGLIVNLNDRCVLVFFPFPFFACGVGIKQANGELLKHMGDSKEAEIGFVP
jgi:hypothetical protein